MDDKYIQLSQKQTEKARMVISSLNLIEIWEKAGATINPTLIFIFTPTVWTLAGALRL